MKKTIRWILCAALAVGTAGTASAALYENSGTYMFTQSGNDPGNPNADLADFSAMVKQWLRDEGISGYEDLALEFYAKVDADDGASEGSGSLDVTYENKGKSGTWATGNSVNLYSVKAGNQYALYWNDSAADFGTWSTEDLFVGKKGTNNPSISHLSAWSFAGGPGGGGGAMNPIPEPGTFVLMGLGLAGLVGVRVRRKR